ncbi:MAG: hypothetical protein K9M57_02190 [Phycisphaerae bacterium]|nr:hypothetical protein [Phycisphaerae bacterium]
MIEKKDFIALLYAENLMEAEKCKTILEDYDVPVEVTHDSPDDDVNHIDGLIVRVPRDYLEEARHILELGNKLDHDFGVDYIDFDDPDDYTEDDYDESGSDQDMDMDMDDIGHFDGFDDNDDDNYF